MSSSSSGGASLLTLRFSLATDLDVAEQDVQAAINVASSLLPNDLPTPPVFSKVTMETLTYHGLGLGFVAMALRSNKREKTKESL